MRRQVTIENIIIWIAYHLPKSLAYWTFIRMATGDGQGSPYALNPGERTVNDVMESHKHWY